jgi:hypothetical protein
LEAGLHSREALQHFSISTSCSCRQAEGVTCGCIDNGSDWTVTRSGADDFWFFLSVVPIKAGIHRLQKTWVCAVGHPTGPGSVRWLLLHPALA